MTTKFKAVDIFNALLETEISGKRYREDKSFKDEDLQSVKDFVEGMGENINDNSIFDPVETMKELSKNRTKFVVDKVVELAVDAFTMPIMSAVNIDAVLEGRSDAFAVRTTFESEVRSFVEKSIITKEFLEYKDERHKDLVMITDIFNLVNKDKEFYKFTPHQLLVPAEDYTLINEFSPREIISYMEANCYITYDEEDAA